MSYELTIYNALLTTLRAAQVSGQDLNFVAASSLFPGMFPNIASLPPESFPAIALEPSDEDEAYFSSGGPSTPTVKPSFMLKGKTRVLAHLLVREGKPGTSVVGDPTATPAMVGMLDFVAAFKNVIQKDMTLGGALGLQKIFFGKTQHTYEFYPIRIAVVPIEFTGEFTSVGR